jgi:hypothetical protein
MSNALLDQTYMIWELTDEGFEGRPYISLCA